MISNWFFYWWFLTHLWRLQDRVDYHVDIPGFNHWKIIRALFHVLRFIIFPSILELHCIIFCKQINPSLITDPYEYQVSMGRWWCFAMNIQCLQILSSLIYCNHTVISLLYCHYMIVISINFSTTLLMFWNVEGLGVDEEEQIGHSQQREEN